MGLTATDVIKLIRQDWSEAQQALPAYFEANIHNELAIVNVLCALLDYQNSLSSSGSDRTKYAEVQRFVIASLKNVLHLKNRDNQAFDHWSTANLFYPKLEDLIRARQWSCAAAVIQLMPAQWAYEKFTLNKSTPLFLLYDFATEARSKSVLEQRAFDEYVQAVIENMGEYTSKYYLDEVNSVPALAVIDRFNLLRSCFDELAQKFYVMDPKGFDRYHDNQSTLPPRIKDFIEVKKARIARKNPHAFKPFIQRYSLRVFLTLDTHYTRSIYNAMGDKKELYDALLNVDQALLRFLVMGATQNPTVEIIQQWQKKYRHDFDRDWSAELDREGFDPLHWLFEAGQFQSLYLIFKNLPATAKKRFVRELERDIKHYLLNPTNMDLNEELLRTFTELDENIAVDYLKSVPKNKREDKTFLTVKNSMMSVSLANLSLLHVAGFSIENFLDEYITKTHLDEAVENIKKFPVLDDFAKNASRIRLEQFIKNLPYLKGSLSPRLWFDLRQITDEQIGRLYKVSRRENHLFLEKLIDLFGSMRFEPADKAIALGILTRLIEVYPVNSDFIFRGAFKILHSFKHLLDILPEDLACTLIWKISAKSIELGLHPICRAGASDLGTVEDFLECLTRTPKAFDLILRKYQNINKENFESLLQNEVMKKAIPNADGCEAFLIEKGFIVKLGFGYALPSAPPAPAVEDFAPPPFEAPSAYALPPEVQAEMSALKARIKDLEEELSDKTDELDALKRDKGIPKEKGRYGSQTHRADAATEIDADIWENFVADQVGGAVKQLLSFHRKSVSDDRKTSPVAESSGIKFK